MELSQWKILKYTYVHEKVKVNFRVCKERKSAIQA